VSLESLLARLGIDTDLVEIETHHGYTVITPVEPAEGPEFDCS
jgi:hypothetical protein